MTAKIQATNTFVLVIRDEVKTEMGGLSIPDSAKKKPSIGTIISVGWDVSDKRILKGKKAVFNLNAGFEIELENETFTVLRGGKEDSQIIAVI